MWKPTLVLVGALLGAAVVALALKLNSSNFLGDLADVLRGGREVRIAVVEWTSERPVGGVKVDAFDGNRREASTVLDRGGRGTFRLPEGHYRLVVDTRTLPDDLIGPTRPDVYVPYQEHRVHWNSSPAVEIDDAPINELVTLYVHRGATISGRVTSGERLRLDGIEIRLTGVASKQPAIHRTVPANSEGEYEGLLQPATYRIQPFYLEGNTGPALPGPQLLQVESGIEYVVDFALESGDYGFSCTLEDPAILPGEAIERWGHTTARLYVPDVAINTHPEIGVLDQTYSAAVLMTETDGEGRLVVEGLLPGKYRLRFSADDFTPSERGERFGAWIAPVDFELKEPGITELGSVRALRERPCEVMIRFSSLSLDPSAVDIRLQYPAIDGAERDPYVRRLEVPASGVVRTFVHTSPDSNAAKLMLRKRGDAEWESVIDLETPPNGSVELAVPFR